MNKQKENVLRTVKDFALFTAKKFFLQCAQSTEELAARFLNELITADVAGSVREIGREANKVR